MLGLVLGGLLTVISWRLAFLINVPIGIVIIVIAWLRIGETHHERLKLDITGALLATLGCTSAVLVFTQGPPRGWVDPWVIGAAVAAIVFFVAFFFVERTAENPLVPFSVFNDRNRVMTFIAWFLGGGVLLTVTVMVGLLAQDVLGYSALRAGICFLPFAVAFGVGNVLATKLAPRIAPRWLIIGGGLFVLAAMLYGSTLDRDIPYFPEPVHADRARRLRHRHHLGDPAAVRGRRGRAARDRPGVGDHADGAEPRRAAGAGRHHGRADVAHALPRRHHRAR